MPKGKIIRDTFEQLAELGQSTVKKTVKQTTKTFSPLQLLESEDEEEKNRRKSLQEKLKKEAGEKGNNKPLDFDNLQEKYQEQDKQKIDNLRGRLFQLSKQEEKEVQTKRKKQKEEEERVEEQQAQEKKKKEEEKKKLEEAPLPKGKQRRSIFSPKRKAQEQHPELRPAVGKQ